MSDPERKFCNTLLWLLVSLSSPRALADDVMAASISSLVHLSMLLALNIRQSPSVCIYENLTRYLRNVIMNDACDYCNLIGHIHIPTCATETVPQWPDPPFPALVISITSSAGNGSGLVHETIRILRTLYHPWHEFTTFSGANS